MPVKYLFVIEIFELHANINVTLSKCSSKDMIKKKNLKMILKKVHLCIRITHFSQNKKLNVKKDTYHGRILLSERKN